MVRILSLLLLLLSTPAGASSVTLAVPDAKDALVVQAKDLYNARTGQTLTVKQYLMAVIKTAIANELAQDQQRESDAAVKAAQDSAEQVRRTEAAKLEQAATSETETAWGLPATPLPTPRPTPTVPVLP